MWCVKVSSYPYTHGKVTGKTVTVTSSSFLPAASWCVGSKVAFKISITCPGSILARINQAFPNQRENIRRSQLLRWSAKRPTCGRNANSCFRIYWVFRAWAWSTFSLESGSHDLVPSEIELKDCALKLQLARLNIITCYGSWHLWCAFQLYIAIWLGTRCYFWWKSIFHKVSRVVASSFSYE